MSPTSYRTAPPRAAPGQYPGPLGIIPPLRDVSNRGVLSFLLPGACAARDWGLSPDTRERRDGLRPTLGQGPDAGGRDPAFPVVPSERRGGAEDMEDIGETRCGMTRGGVQDQRSGPPGPVDFSVALLRELAAAVGEERISTDRRALEEVATDATALWRISRSTGTSPSLPPAAVRPATSDEVAAGVDAPGRYRSPLSPYRGASSPI